MTFDHFPGYGTDMDRIRSVSDQPKKLGLVGGGIGCGIVVGFFRFVYKANYGLTGESMLAWPAWIIIGAAVGFLLEKLIYAGHESRQKSAANDLAAYKRAFEAEAQRMSSRYARSDATGEIVRWLTGALVRSIQAANRAGHIAEITVPFTYCVYTTEIKFDCSDYGCYNFAVERCADLNGPLDQAALAIAIASALRSGVAATNLKNSRDINSELTVSYRYEQNHIAATITYTAVNGNYCTERSW